MKSQCSPRRRTVILRRQACTWAADSLTVVLATELETAPYPKGLGYSPFGFSLVTSTTHQGTLEESHPHMHHAIGIQNVRPTVNPEVTHELTPGPLSCDPRSQGEHSFTNSPMDERAFLEVHESSGEVTAEAWNKKSPRWDTLEKIRGTPQHGRVQHQESTSRPNRGK